MIKTPIQKIWQRHKEEIEALQAACPHTRKTVWMNEAWAPAHYTGRELCVCEDCNKVVGARSKTLTEIMGEQKQGGSLKIIQNNS